jgi:multiple antibiotic resistance protein
LDCDQHEERLEAPIRVQVATNENLHGDVDAPRDECRSKPAQYATAANSLIPLIMFAAGPGTITAIVTLAAVHTPDGLPVTAIVAAIVGAGVTLAALLLAIGVGSRVSSGTQSTVTRFMGLIVASMGMQFVLTGLKEFFSL